MAFFLNDQYDYYIEFDRKIYVIKLTTLANLIELL